MQSANLANKALRQAEVGHVWEEVITAAQASVEVPKFSTFRVRAGAGTTVTIDSVLAMTMASGEIALFNAGNGDPSDTKLTVTVTLGVANGWMQVARNDVRIV